MLWYKGRLEFQDKNIYHLDFVSKFKAIFTLQDFEWGLSSMKNMQRISIINNFHLFPLFISYQSVKIEISHSYVILSFYQFSEQFHGFQATVSQPDHRPTTTRLSVLELATKVTRGTPGLAHMTHICLILTYFYSFHRKIQCTKLKAQILNDHKMAPNPGISG